MTLPTSDTIVTYPDGATTSTGSVLHIEPLQDGRSAIILDTTAFHPVDAAWPDQPADRGVITTNHGSQPILGAVTGGIHDGELRLGEDLPVRTGTDGWIFVVAHIVEGAPPAIGESVQIDVDKEYRAALSAAHTACHLAALALDATLSAAWSKPVPTDALGNPAFDALAIQHSRIHPHRSTDIYRIGKSLRRKGFAPTALADPSAVAGRINTQLAQWIAAGGAARIERNDDTLSARRTWVCELPAGRTDIPCGGTHIHNLTELSAVTASLTIREIEGGLELTMETSSTAT
ncbi:metal-dependent hydrolase [Cryobacterium sp. N22]|uniref:metal-dependent hydrolase n=1 Tax=Cryobacterium sp. N22 TaxID=2048290 RepID=UPI000CE46291|nr:metal-dependent hydrolase [Cryobacterium sp. N22]